MAGGGGQQVSRTELDPTLKPYVEFGLSEAQRLYQGQQPQYYPGQTYVGPSGYTTEAMQAAADRARAGSPLTQAALGQQQATVEGGYLGGNPFFQGAFQAAARPLEMQYMDAINRARSAASSAGRYGSGAMGQLEGRAEGALATGLSDVAGRLAYQNYADERARQEAAATRAPALAETQYGDIQRLANVGAMSEDYQQRQLASDIARFNFGQLAPMQALQSYLGSVYGAPAGMMATQPIIGNPLLGALGGAAAGYALGGPQGYGGPGAVAGGLLGAYGSR
jgi:hypothetical protein